MTSTSSIAEMDKSLQFPGVSNAWTMPIKARIDMLSTGIRTPVGVKVFGKDLAEIDKVAREIEAVIRKVPGTSSAYAERAHRRLLPERRSRPGAACPLRSDGRRRAGRDRHGARRRAGNDDGRGTRAYTRSASAIRATTAADPEAIANQVLIPLPEGGTVPLGEVAKVSLAQGPSSIRTENAQLATYIYVDLRDRDIGGYVADAQKAVAARCNSRPGITPPGAASSNIWSAPKARLKIVVPVTLLIIFLLLYLNFRRITETLIVMLSVPFALVGGFWLMWWLGFNLSVAVAVGFIALAGVAAETGVVMLIYLDHALTELKEQRAARGTLLHQRRSLRRHHVGRGRARTAQDDDRRRHHGRSPADHVEPRHGRRGHAADGEFHNRKKNGESTGSGCDLRHQRRSGTNHPLRRYQRRYYRAQTYPRKPARKRESAFAR